VVDLLRLGRSVRALRIRRRLRQEDLAAEAGVSRAKVARAEAGRILRLPLGDLVAVAAALGADVDIRLRWRGEALDRLLDAAHAALVDACVQLLNRLGWETAVEVTFAVGGERGSVDILAWHPASRTLLIVEAKSVVPDAQAMLAAHDRKVRLGRQIGLSRGWSATSVAGLLVIGDSSTARDRVRRLRSLFEVAYPLRGWAARRWLSDPATAVGGTARRPSALLFLRYVHRVSTTAGVVPRQRIRKRDRLARSASTSMG
jgi:transcriptional regulator with XRE-family HTH domain